MSYLQAVQMQVQWIKSCLKMLFADVLADNGRLTLTGEVISAYGKMMSAHRGEVICSVTTAQV